MLALLLAAHLNCDQNLKIEKIYGQQVLQLFEKIISETSIEEPIDLFSGTDNPCREYNGTNRSSKGKRLRITLHRRVFREWSYIALAGILAHEIGHICVGDLDIKHRVISAESNESQDRANAVAILIVGPESLRQFLLAQGWNKNDASQALGRAGWIALSMARLPDICPQIPN